MPELAAWKSFLSQPVLLRFTESPPPHFPVIQNAQHQHSGENPGNSLNNVATSLVTCSSTRQDSENKMTGLIPMNFIIPFLSAHWMTFFESFWPTQNIDGGHYNRIVIFSLCLLAEKYSGFVQKIK